MSSVVGFWFAAVLLIVGAAAAGAAKRYILSGSVGLVGVLSALFALGAMPVEAAGEAATFWICALIAVPAAVTMIAARKAVHSALCLAIVMITLAVLYAALEAPFLAFVQIIVYTGAVLMLFLFVLMLVGVDSSDSLSETIRGQRLAAVVLGSGFLLLVLSGIAAALASSKAGSLEQANAQGNVLGIANELFIKYVFAFEVTSALLITAALGAMVLAHKERRRVGQKVQQRRRVESGKAGPLTPPGVYARHNAVDTPGLLPDGTPSEESVHQVFRRVGSPPGRLSAGELADAGAGTVTITEETAQGAGIQAVEPAEPPQPGEPAEEKESDEK